MNPPAKGFGGKDSVKGNRQGSLSRRIKQLFETFLSFKKFSSLSKRLFRQAEAPARRGLIFRLYSVSEGGGSWQFSSTSAAGCWCSSRCCWASPWRPSCWGASPPATRWMTRCSASALNSPRRRTGRTCAPSWAWTGPCRCSTWTGWGTPSGGIWAAPTSATRTSPRS